MTWLYIPLACVQESGCSMKDLEPHPSFLELNSALSVTLKGKPLASRRLSITWKKGILDESPIWSDLTTFDGAALRGKVDCIVAGFPCQPHSVAGNRKGTDDERWLWNDIARIIRDVSPRFVFLENVRGLLSSGGFTPVLSSLVGLGFNIEWGVLAASEVGASHKRERVFILAYRDSLRKQQPQRAISKSGGRTGDESEVLGNSNSDGLQARGLSGRSQSQDSMYCSTSSEMGNTMHNGCIANKITGSTNTGNDSIKTGKITAIKLERSSHSQLANARRIGLRSRGSADGENDRPIISPNSQFLFAPGPESKHWSSILSASPYLAPAIESSFCVSLDGLAVVVDESRSDQIRAAGNGVVALCAATAFVLLAKRAGII